MRLDIRLPKRAAETALKFALVAAMFGWSAPSWAASQQTHIEIDASGPPANSFRSQDAFGGALDGGEQGELMPTYTPHNIATMRAAGLPRVTYRLRTELGIEVWHWTDQGRWSDAAHQQGYWTGDPTPRPHRTLTWGYKLPRRGDTVDNANNSSFSRLDDGDETSFWKSNPYLDPRLSHAPKASPQWAVIDLGAEAAVDGLRVVWGTPFARRYAVQYWVGIDEGDDKGRWITFETGKVEDGRGGTVTLHLASKPVKARFLRLLLETPSGTAPVGSTDPRDGMGYAVAELYAGSFDAGGSLQDAIRHGVTRQTQSAMTVSSTDPWHRAVDKDIDLEQIAPEFMIKSGITNGLPLMMPVGTFYDTPENAAAELRYLKNAKVPFHQVELGEEPDGQLVDGADYGALYLAFYDRLHAEFPDLSFGGPSLQSGVTDTWLNDNPNHSWNGQFVAYLKSRGRLDALNFFSFERYPFDDICGSLPGKLMYQSQMMATLMRRVAAEGTPTTIPWIISEYGFSAFSGRAMVEMPSALLNADMIADFFTNPRRGRRLHLRLRPKRADQPAPDMRRPGQHDAVAGRRERRGALADAGLLRVADADPGLGAAGAWAEHDLPGRGFVEGQRGRARRHRLSAAPPRRPLVGDADQPQRICGARQPGVQGPGGAGGQGRGRAVFGRAVRLGPGAPAAGQDPAAGADDEARMERTAGAAAAVADGGAGVAPSA